MKKTAPCVGVSLVFYDPTAPKDEQWSYHIELAFDPHHPPKEEERKRLQQSFEYINAGVQRIMNVDEPEVPNEYAVRGDLN